MVQVSSDWRAKFEEPAPHGFVGDVRSPFRQKILYVSIAQSEPSIEPNCVANDVRWKSMACEGDGSHPDMLTDDEIEVRALNVTMPSFVPASD